MKGPDRDSDERQDSDYSDRRVPIRVLLDGSSAELVTADQPGLPVPGLVAARSQEAAQLA